MKLNLEKFTEQEQEFIKANYDRLSDKELAEKLGENPNAVYYFRLKERLKKSDRWTEEKVLVEIKELQASGKLRNISASEPLYAAARRSFGSWKGAIEAAGFEYDKVVKKGRRKLNEK